MKAILALTNDTAIFLTLVNWLLMETLKERGTIEKDLRKSEKRFRLLAENAMDFITQQTIEGDYVYVSPSCRSLLGYEPEQMLGRSCYDFFHENDKTKINRAPLYIDQDIPNTTFTHRFRKRDGSYIWFETTQRFIRSRKTKKILEIHSASRDITTHILEERARLRSQKLAKVSRLSTMEEMASGLAHEINQPLAAVINYTRGCVRHMQLNPQSCDKKLLEIMEKAASQAERAGEIIHRLKNFFAKGKLYKAPEKINRIIKETIQFIKHDIIESKTKIVYRLSRKLPTISVDRIQIQQVILNLLQNALEAMQDTPIHKRQITIKTSLTAHRIEVIVSDTGPGFAPELAQKIYQSFFTTKPNGTGMGLPISRSIIEAHQGLLMIRSPKYKKEGWVCFTLPLEHIEGEAA